MTNRSKTASGLPESEVKSLRHLLGYLRPYRWWIAAALGSMLFTSSAVLAMGGALGYLIDNGIASGNMKLLHSAYAGLLATVLLLALATYARYFFISSVGERVVADIRNDVYRKLTQMDVAFFETTRTGEILSRLTADTTLLQTVVGSSVSIFLRNLLLLAGGLTMLLITSGKLTLYVLLMLPLVIAPIIIIGKQVRRASRATQNRVADISVQAEETISAIRTIQALAMEQSECQRFAKTVERTQRTSLRRIRLRAMLTALVIALVFGAVITVLWVGGREVVAGTMSAGQLSSFIFYAVVVAAALGAVSEVIGELQRAAGAAERLMALKNLKPSLLRSASPRPMPSPLQGQISFDDVSFAYPSRLNQPALEQCSISIAPGQMVAIVGTSGAGKSTLFHLLMRFYDPTQGRITVDGIDIREFAPEALRTAIGLVPQDPALFSADVWYNIRCGRHNYDNEAVRRAAADAAALDFIEALPQGFNTYLGEKGVRLSGGQRQRIAIARALLRQPKILLLDEATSALDSESEAEVQRALATARRERTVMVIAHRLSTVISADHIIVLSHGRIQATGTHQSLMRESPLYQKLVNLQFRLPQEAALPEDTMADTPDSLVLHS